jgi:cell division transport system ATP-binding protein
MITFEHISKQYENNYALSDINLSIPHKDFVTLIGPSGSGKTTFLHLLAGLIKPTHGNITSYKQNISDLNHDDLQMYRRTIGVIFQDYKLLEDRTVWGNLEFLLESLEVPSKEIPYAIEDALITVHLEEKIHAYPQELSGGEQQRLAIARAIIHKPHCILADEPTGNLDPALAHEIGSILLDINSKGTTVIQISHDTNLVNFLNKRVLILKNGKIIGDEKQSGYINI